MDGGGAAARVRVTALAIAYLIPTLPAAALIAVHPVDAFENDVRVEVDGRIDGNGILVADEVEFRQSAAARVAASGSASRLVQRFGGARRWPIAGGETAPASDRRRSGRRNPLESPF